MSTVEILRKARAHLSDPENWHQGGYGSDGRVTCMVGAVKLTVGMPLQREVVFCEDATRAAGALQCALGEDPEESKALLALFRFNDSPDTTHEVMLAMFDRAIADELAREQEHSVPSLVDASPVELVA